MRHNGHGVKAMRQENENIKIHKELLMGMDKKLSDTEQCHLPDVSGQLFEEAVDFGKWLLKNAVYDSRKYYNLREDIGKFDKDDTYEVCELYLIWKETLK
jgi:hypothetical protein